MISLSGPAGHAGKAPKPPATPRFDRAQLMLMNLNRGHGSTGYYLADSLRQTRGMVKALDKALRQLEQVERNYGKSRGRADEHCLGSTADRIGQCKTSAEQLEKQLHDALQDLRSSIQQTLILEGG